jgi:hypothetical protein
MDFKDLDKALEGFSREFPNKTNSFRILGIESRERVYSSLIGWFFKVIDKKTFSKVFFEYFLDLIKKIIDQSSLIDRLEKINFFSLTECEILNEFYFTDILLHFEKEHFVIVFENKIYADQGKNQLAIYREKITNHYKSKNKKYQFLFLYLTTNRSEPNDSEWYSLSHEDIYNCVKSAKEKTNYQYNLIDDYLNIMEENILGISDKQLKAKALYRKFRNELEFVFNNKEDNTSFVTAMIVEKLQPYIDSKEITLLRESNTYVNFTTPAIREIVGSYGNGDWFGEGSTDYFSFEFAARNDHKIVFRAVVGPSEKGENLKLRDYLINNPSFEGNEIFKKKGKLGKIYTTVLSIEVAKIDFNNGNIEQLSRDIQDFVELFFKEKFIEFTKYFDSHKDDIKNILKEQIYRTY